MICKYFTLKLNKVDFSDLDYSSYIFLLFIVSLPLTQTLYELSFVNM